MNLVAVVQWLHFRSVLEWNFVRVLVLDILAKDFSVFLISVSLGESKNGSVAFTSISLNECSFRCVMPSTSDVLMQ